MRILQGDLQLLTVFLQGAQEVLGEAACNQQVLIHTHTHTNIHTHAEGRGQRKTRADQLKAQGAVGLTQLFSGEGQAGGVLVQVLVEVDAQVAQLLLDGFDLL